MAECIPLEERATERALMGMPEQAEVSGSAAALERRRALGRDLRALRKSRDMTLAELALQIGRSVGFLSQVERGLSDISVDDLRGVATILDVPISWFLVGDDAPASERGVVVRAGARRHVGSSESGLTEELLSPDLGGSFEIIRSEFAPGATLETAQQRDTEEAGYLMAGTFEIEIGGTWYRLEPGDSFRFTNEPYRWRNPGEVPAVAIWVIAPPVY